jgi:cystinosin
MTPWTDSLTLLSTVLGPTYTTCWSLRYWFMSYEVWKQKSAEGLSVDYLILNFVGFVCYLSYNAYGLYNPECSFHDQTHLADMLFALHALLANTVQFCQYMYYPKGQNRVSMLWGSVSAISVFFIIIMGIIDTNLEAMFLFMGLIKVILTIFKYIPQVVLNFKRKSTKGLSIESIWLDLVGGSLSDFQILVDHLIIGGNFFASLNYAKFLLGIVSVTFDTIFLTQHYKIYNEGRPGLVREIVNDALAKANKETPDMDLASDPGLGGEPSKWNQQKHVDNGRDEGSQLRRSGEKEEGRQGDGELDQVVVRGVAGGDNYGTFQNNTQLKDDDQR